MRKLQPDIIRELSTRMVGMDMGEHLAQMPLSERLKLLKGIAVKASKHALLKEENSWDSEDVSIVASVGSAIMLARSIFIESGQNVYSMGPKARETFSKLKLGKLAPKDLKLPFKGIYIDIGTNSGLKIWGGPRTKWHEVEGAYVYAIPEGLIATSDEGSLERPEVIGVILWGPCNSRSIDPTDDAIFNVMLRTDKLTSGVDAEKHFKSILSGKRFAQATDETSDELLGAREGLSKNSIPDIVKAVRIVLNSILYITSAEPEISEDPRVTEKRAIEKKLLKAGPSKKGKLKRRLAKHSTCVIRQLAPSLEASGNSYSKGSGVSLHTVSAHWHRYWVKSGHRLWETGQQEDDKGRRIVRIFVSEYKKGDDLAGRITSRRYKIEEPS